MQRTNCREKGGVTASVGVGATTHSGEGAPAMYNGNIWGSFFDASTRVLLPTAILRDSKLLKKGAIMPFVCFPMVRSIVFSRSLLYRSVPLSSLKVELRSLL